MRNKEKARIDYFVYMNKMSVLEDRLNIEKDQVLENLSLTMDEYQIQTLIEVVDRL